MITEIKISKNAGTLKLILMLNLLAGIFLLTGDVTARGEQSNHKTEQVSTIAAVSGTTTFAFKEASSILYTGSVL